MDAKEKKLIAVLLDDWEEAEYKLMYVYVESDADERRMRAELSEKKIAWKKKLRL